MPQHCSQCALLFLFLPTFLKPLCHYFKVSSRCSRRHWVASVSDTRGKLLPSCCCQWNISEDDNACVSMRYLHKNGIRCSGCFLGFFFFRTDHFLFREDEAALWLLALGLLIVSCGCSATVPYHLLSEPECRSVPSVGAKDRPWWTEGRGGQERRQGRREGGRKKEKEIYECASISCCKS